MKLSSASNQLIRLALNEDIGKGDITSNRLVPNTAKGSAVIIAREAGVFCGSPAAKKIAAHFKPALKIKVLLKDGQVFRRNQKILMLKGSIRAILAAERTLLNFLGHLSGISTLTASFVKKTGKQIKILDTRKTTPGMRELEKYAVKMGGGSSHRMGLWDEIFVKENHRIYGRLSALKKYAGRFVIEVRNQRELDQAIALNPRVILFDNFTPGRLKPLIRHARKKKTRALLEASGGISLSNVRAYARSGIDQVSIGSLTHSVRSVDFSLLIQNSK